MYGDRYDDLIIYTGEYPPWLIQWHTKYREPIDELVSFNQSFAIANLDGNTAIQLNADYKCRHAKEGEIWDDTSTNMRYEVEEGTWRLAGRTTPLRVVKKAAQQGNKDHADTKTNAP